MPYASALLLVGLAAFSMIILFRGLRVDPAGRSMIMKERLQGFLLVGAAALVLSAIAVIIIAVVAPYSGNAEKLGMFALFGYALYLVITAILIRLSR